MRYLCWILILSAGLLSLDSVSYAQRIIITPSGRGQFGDQEFQLQQKLEVLLSGKLVDRAQADARIKEIQASNSDLYDPATAVKVGKLAGATDTLSVMVTAFSYSKATQGSFSKKVLGTIILRATARLVHVETGKYISAEANYRTDPPFELGSTRSSMQFGSLKLPESTHAADETSIVSDHLNTAYSDIAGKLVAGLGLRTSQASGAATAPVEPSLTALVAGIAAGSVYINKGTEEGVKVGDTFQITREVSTGLADPSDPSKMITDKQSICLLTIIKAQEKNASGTCKGGLPQAKDDAVQTHP